MTLCYHISCVSEGCLRRAGAPVDARQVVSGLGVCSIAIGVARQCCIWRLLNERNISSEARQSSVLGQIPVLAAVRRCQGISVHAGGQLVVIILTNNTCSYDPIHNYSSVQPTRSWSLSSFALADKFLGRSSELAISGLSKFLTTFQQHFSKLGLERLA